MNEPDLDRLKGVSCCHCAAGCNAASDECAGGVVSILRFSRLPDASAHPNVVDIFHQCLLATPSSSAFKPPPGFSKTCLT